jgi:ABC-type sugar transport system permease subunit
LAGVALAALILATLLLGALSLIATDSSASLFEWARAYLFRNAIKNTLIVAAVATGLGFVFAGLATLATKDAGPVRTILLYGLLIPLATPAPLAALLWRMTLVAGAPGFPQPLAGLAATGMVSTWRIAPLLALILLAWPRRRQRWLALGALAAYAAMADVATPLLLTGGEPFNATHTLASWTFQQVAVNGGWRAGAVAALAWLGLLALPVVALLYALGANSPAVRPTGDRFPGSRTPIAGTLAAILLIAWMLTPLLVPALSDPAWLGRIIPLLGSAAYWRGWLNTLLLMGGVALVAAPIAGVAALWPAAGWSNIAGKPRRAGLGRGLLGLALLSWPVAFIGLGWLAARTDAGTSALLWLFYSALTICLGVGLSFTIHSDTVSAVVDGKRSAGLAIAIGVFVIWHGFSGTLILRAPLAAHPIGPAITTGMGAPITPNSPLLAASLLTSLLAWLACASILNYAKLR